MRALLSLPVLAICLAACTTMPAMRTPTLPPGIYGVYLDNDTGAINQSSWAFASAANTKGNPIDAVKAVIALEYLPGELKENPRWVGMDASVHVRMAMARNELRQILGIRPDAPSQLVVNILLDLNMELETGNEAAVQQVLSAPIFTQPPERTLQLLSNLPYVPEANLATTRAAQEMFSSSGGGRS